MSIAVEPEATRLSVAVGGREIIFETGVVAKQAHGAVLVKQEGTVVLATAVGRTEGRPGADFFPLTVDVEEKMYAAGKIPGGFFKREGRSGEKAILTARMVDRPIRPLWPKGYKNEVQVIITTLSADQVHGHDILGMNGASAALMLSPLPFMGPVGAVRVGRIDGQLLLNPTLVELQESTLDLVVCGTPEAITMVEAGAEEIDEDTLVEALELAHGADQADLPAADRAGQQGRHAQVVGRCRHRAAALQPLRRPGGGHPGRWPGGAAAQGRRGLPRGGARDQRLLQRGRHAAAGAHAVRHRAAGGRGPRRGRLPQGEAAVRRPGAGAVRRRAGLQGAQVGQAGRAAGADRGRDRPRLPQPRRG